MKLKNLVNYIKYSGLWMGFVLNPYHWEFKLEKSGPTEMDPKGYLVFLSIGPVWIRAVLDDGTW